MNPVDTAEQVPPRNAPDVDDGYDYAPSNGRDISQGDTNNQTLPMNPVDTAEQLPPRNAPDVDDGYDYAPSNGRDISQVDMNTPLLSNLPQPNIPTNKSIVGLNGENMK